MPLKVLTTATAQTVEVDDVKTFLRIRTTADGGTTSEDALLLAMIKAAESYGENYTKRTFMRKQFELRFDDFPSASTGMIKLPRPPLSTASSDVVITYVEDTTAGNTTTIPTTSVEIDYYSEPGYVYPVYDSEWPDDARDERNAVRITFFSGYTSVNIPEDIKHWVKLRVGSMYEHRESVMVSNFGNPFAEMPRSLVDGLLDPFVVMEHE